MRNTTIAVNKIDMITIMRKRGGINVAGKKLSITTTKAWAEKENVAIFAIHRKKPIIKARKPPSASLLKL